LEGIVSVQKWHIAEADRIYFYINPLCVTICPETFSNLCVGNVRGM